MIHHGDFISFTGRNRPYRSHDNHFFHCGITSDKCTVTKQHHFMTWPYWHTFRDALVCKYMLTYDMARVVHMRGRGEGEGGGGGLFCRAQQSAPV